MELGGLQESDPTMPIPMNFGSIHESSRLKMLSCSAVPGSGVGGGGGTGGSTLEEIRPNVSSEPSFKKTVKYRECLKNHAAGIGGHCLDGCGEFMPSGEEGSLEALKCAACNCHRNFHRREGDGEPPCYCFSPRKERRRFAPLALPAHGPLTLQSSSSCAHPSQQMIMAMSANPNEYDEQDLGLLPGSVMHRAFGHPGLNPIPVTKKRFRTKFSTEQKEKMYDFAEKLGWKIQKQDEAAVNQFCSDVGVKRHVLKVWMHNNKHIMGKKVSPNEIGSNDVGVNYLDHVDSQTNSTGLHT